jgi:bacillopeptidase F
MATFGCAGWHRDNAEGGANEAPKPLPLVTLDPASSEPLDPHLTVLAEESNTGWLRVLVDLREQLDVAEMLRRQAARDLPRSEARRIGLAAMKTVADRNTAKLVPLLDELLVEGELDYYETLRFRSRVFVSASPSALRTIRRHPDVAAIIPEYDSVREARRAAGKQSRAVGLADPVPPGDSWGVEMLELRQLWERGIDGRGVVVGSLDSGVIGQHDALREGRLAERPSWYDPVRGSTAPVDTVPHGSQVLSCAVGREVRGQAIGTAPGASWVAALSNLFNSYNNVNMSRSADWMIFDAQPDVVLGAWGHGKSSCDPQDLPMLEAFRLAGMVPVFAAGNDGPDPSSIQAPAALPGYSAGGPLVVAAIDRHGEIIEASSRGPSPCEGARRVPDVAAPGWNVPAPAAGKPYSLGLASGTSMSVGWVGGVVAMMLQVAPELPVWEIERIVRETARDLPPEGWDVSSGHGVIDPAAAVAAAREAAR